MTWQFTQRVLLVFAVLLTLGFIWFARHALLIGFVGLLVGLVFVSLANWTHRFLRLPYKWALAAVVTVLIGLVVGAGALLAPGLSEQFAELGETIPRQFEKVQKSLEQKSWFQNIKRVFPDQPAAPEAGGGALSTVSRIFTLTADAISGLLLVLFLGIFFAVDPNLYKRGALSLIPNPHVERAREIMDRLICVLKHWLLGQFIAMTTVGVVVGVALAIIGVPLAAAMGIIAGLLEFIPFVGPILSAVPALLLASGEGTQAIMAVAAVFLGVQFLEGNVLTPFIQQRTVDLPPVITLLAIVVMGSAFGFLGIFAATPLAAVVMVLVQELYIKDTLQAKISAISTPPE